MCKKVFSLIIIFLISGDIFLGNSTAQTIKTSDGLGRSYFKVEDDMKTYEIIHEEHGKEYADYYRAIRERIIQKLKRNYVNNYFSADKINNMTLF